MEGESPVPAGVSSEGSRTANPEIERLRKPKRQGWRITRARKTVARGPVRSCRYYSFT